MHDRDLALLCQPGQTGIEGLDDTALPVPQLVEIDFRRRETDAERGAFLGVVDHVCDMQQGLRRNAADVQAHAAKCGVALDQHDALAEVGSTKRGRIAARSGAEHDDLGMQTIPWCSGGGFGGHGAL